MPPSPKKKKKAKPSPEQVTQHKDLPPRNWVGTTYVQTLAFGLARAVDLGFHLKSQWSVAGQCHRGQVSAEMGCEALHHWWHCLGFVFHLVEGEDLSHPLCPLLPG